MFRNELPDPQRKFVEWGFGTDLRKLLTVHWNRFTECAVANSMDIKVINFEPCAMRSRESLDEQMAIWQRHLTLKFAAVFI
jgi:hypothetical protein